MIGQTGVWSDLILVSVGPSSKHHHEWKIAYMRQSSDMSSIFIYGNGLHRCQVTESNCPNCSDLKKLATLKKKTYLTCPLHFVCLLVEPVSSSS